MVKQKFTNLPVYLNKRKGKSSLHIIIVRLQAFAFITFFCPLPLLTDLGTQLRDRYKFLNPH